MDELKMEGLELPETGESYDNIPDASEGLDDTKAERPSMNSVDDLSDIEMPSFSEMDGTAPASPAESGTPVSLEKPSEPKPMFEDMSAPAKPQSSAQTTSQSSYTYQSTNSTSQGTTGTYQSVSGSSNPRVSSSMDDLYNARKAVDPARYEKGRKKTKIVAGIGIGVYAYNTLTYLLSLAGNPGLSNLLHFGLSAGLLYLFIRFFRGSDGAKNVLATLIGIDVGYNIIGLITAGVAAALFSSIGLGGIFGLLAVVGIISLIARCVMLYFLVLDDDISEYSKNKQ